LKHGKSGKKIAKEATNICHNIVKASVGGNILPNKGTWKKDIKYNDKLQG